MSRLETLSGRAGDRLDQFLAGSSLGVTRSQVQRWIGDGRVRIDARVATRSAERLAGGERIEVEILDPTPARLHPESIPLHVLFEDESILVLDKPAGLVVHPSAGHASATLVHAVLAHVPDLPGIGGERRPGIVHRLDRETSGVIVIAKDEAAYHSLQTQFEKRSVEKIYRALVVGAPPADEGEITGAIGRHPKDRKKMAVVSQRKGRAATTRFLILERFPRHTELEVRPTTGRTHQIRVHLASVGSPVLGDQVYTKRSGGPSAPRTMLHAWRIRIHHPRSGESSEFEAPLPRDYLDVRQSLREGVSQDPRSEPR
ncbi:MAG: RluA family pseudouridine synthase [Anaerolineales bacterium]